MADISVTGLLQPPRIALLKELYGDEIEEDISQRLWSTFGTALHEIIERGAKDLPNYIPEQRLYCVVDDCVVSGGIDLQEEIDGKVNLVDWKTTSAWAVTNGKIDWEYQLNSYAFLMWKNKGIRVSGLQVGALIKDWSKRTAQFNSEYPQLPIVMIDIPLWSIAQQEAFLKDRVTEHKIARLRHELSGELPQCTDREMWATSGGWAVVKQGAKRASKLFDDEQSAEAYALAASKGGIIHNVEKRPVNRTRCEEYCPVNSVCEQYKQWANTQKTS